MNLGVFNRVNLKVLVIKNRIKSDVNYRMFTFSYGIIQFMLCLFVIVRFASFERKRQRDFILSCIILAIKNVEEEIIIWDVYIFRTPKEECIQNGLR